MERALSYYKVEILSFRGKSVGKDAVGVKQKKAKRDCSPLAGLYQGTQF